MDWSRAAHSKFFKCDDYRIFDQNFEDFNRIYALPYMQILSRNLQELEQKNLRM